MITYFGQNFFHLLLAEEWQQCRMQFLRQFSWEIRLRENLKEGSLRFETEFLTNYFE